MLHACTNDFEARATTVALLHHGGAASTVRHDPLHEKHRPAHQFLSIAELRAWTRSTFRLDASTKNMHASCAGLHASNETLERRNSGLER